MILNELLAFYSAFLNIQRSSVLAALFGCYVAGATSVKLLSSRRVLRIPYNRAPFHVTYAKPHTQGACVFICNLPPALSADRPGSFTCCCGNTGERIPKQESAQEVDHGEENSPAAPSGTQTCNI